MLLEAPARLVASAAITRTNTRTGATAFKALTNNVPKIEMEAAHWGINTASRIPKMIPTRINFTKLVSLTQRQKFLIIFIPPQFNTLIIAK